MENEPKNSNKTLFVFIGITGLIIAGLCLFFILNRNQFGIKPAVDNKSSLKNSDSIAKIKKNVPFEILEDFPFFAGNGHVFFDAEDTNTVWLSFSGAIVKYNLLNDTWEKAATGVKGLDNSPWSLVKKGDNIYFSLYQTGFEKINLKTGQTKNYSVKDGLINNTNLKLYDDPETSDIWIATFGGVSRFNTETEKFTNYTSQLGNGTHWSINDLVVNKDYVWAVVIANAYHSGGIGRYEKKTDVWKFWGPEFFNATQRVDIVFGMDAMDGRAVLNVLTTGNISGDRVVEYNLKNDKWEELFKSKGAFSNFTYIGNRVYMRGGDLNVYYFDRETKKVIPTEIKGLGAPSSYSRLSRDFYAQKLMFIDWPNSVVLYDFQNNRTKALKFDQKAVLLSKLITANKEIAVFTNGKEAIIHNFKDGSDKVIASFVEITEDFEGKIIGDFLALIVPPVSGMGDCDPGKFVLINLKKGEVEKNSTIPDYCYNLAFIGSSLSEIYMSISDSDNNLESIKKYDTEKNVFVDVPIESVNITNLDPVLGYYQVKVWTQGGKNIAQSVYSQSDYSNNEKKIEIYYNGKTETKVFVLKSDNIDGFGSPVRPVINTMAFDAAKPNLLYIGTNVGLLVYNLDTKKEYLATVKDGLASNNVVKIISLDSSLILSSNTGAYIYRFNYSKLPK